MPDFEPDYIAEMQNTPQHSPEVIEPLLSEDAVFEKAQKTQESLGAVRLKGEEAFSYWREHSQLAIDLTAEASEAGLIDKIAIIQGPDIEVHNTVLNVLTNRATVQALSREKRTEACLQSTMCPDAISGPFKGFTLLFTPISDGDSTTYMPILAYKLLGRSYNSQIAVTTNYSTGYMTTTSLNFEDDVNAAERQITLSNLALLAPYATEYIKNIDQLTMNKEISINILREIAFYAQGVCESLKNDDGTANDLLPTVEDTLCDLIKNYLGERQEYTIFTNAFLKQDENEEQGIKLLKVIPTVFDATIQDVVFLDDHPRMPKTSLVDSDKSIYFIIGGSDGGDFTYIPVTALENFAKNKTAK